MNATQQVTRASEFLQDPTNVRFPAAQVLEYVNDGQRDFARSTSLNQKLSSPLVVSATAPAHSFYTLPADFLELSAGGVWCLFNGLNIKLRPITPNEMGTNWDAITTNQPYAYVLPEEFGLTELRVWPNPLADLTGVTIYYTALPVDLVAGGSPTTSSLPPQYHIAFVYYAVAMCYLADGQYKDPSKYQLFMDMYKREMRDAQMAYERRFSAAPLSIQRPYL